MSEDNRRMSEVEKFARALCKEAGFIPDYEHLYEGVHWARFVPAAENAIKMMPARPNLIERRISQSSMTISDRNNGCSYHLFGLGADNAKEILRVLDAVGLRVVEK